MYVNVLFTLLYAHTEDHCSLKKKKKKNAMLTMADQLLCLNGIFTASVVYWFSMLDSCD